MIRRSLASLERGVDTYTSAEQNGTPSKSKDLSLSLRCRLYMRALEKRRFASRGLLVSLIAVVLMLCRSLTIEPSSSSINNETSKTTLSNKRRIRQRNTPVTVQLANGDDHLSKVSQAKPASGIQKDWLGEEWDGQSCVPMHKWQLPEYSPSSCNTMHEADLKKVELINTGGSRIAWRLQDVTGEIMVIKTPKFNDDSFDPDFLEHGWLDTIAMERLTKSPFVMTIYGNCGFSQILELGEFSFHDYVKHARQQGEKTTPSDRLKIGFQLASGIADMHSIDGDRPSLAHNDIDGGQIILVDGVFKLSDFHLASIKYEDQEGEVCHERPKNLSNHLDKMRAPEELHFKYMANFNGKYIHRDKADVWALGNMLYNTLTKKYVFEGITTAYARNKILKGRLARIPAAFEDSKEPSDQAMIQAIRMAWTFNPDDRPSARQITDYLRSHIADTTDDSFWRVSVPRLPSNYRYTESEFINDLNM